MARTKKGPSLTTHFTKIKNKSKIIIQYLNMYIHVLINECTNFVINISKLCSIYVGSHLETTSYHRWKRCIYVSLWYTQLIVVIFLTFLNYPMRYQCLWHLCLYFFFFCIAMSFYGSFPKLVAVIFCQHQMWYHGTTLISIFSILRKNFSHCIQLSWCTGIPGNDLCLKDWLIKTTMI